MEGLDVSFSDRQVLNRLLGRLDSHQRGRELRRNLESWRKWHGRLSEAVTSVIVPLNYR